jgi:hypothetical protein
MSYDYIAELWPIVAVTAVPAAFLASRGKRSFAVSWVVVFFAKFAISPLFFCGFGTAGFL